MPSGGNDERISLAIGFTEEECDALLLLIARCGDATVTQTDTIRGISIRLRSTRTRLQRMKHPELRAESPNRPESLQVDI
jgi:hypothetical protein